MNHRALLTAAIVFVAASQFAAAAGHLTVTVDGIPTEDGVILVSVCPDAESFRSRRCPFKARTDASVSNARAEFRELPAGVYAVLVVQDLNGNRRLDKNFLGMPTEPFGFSNDPELRFGPPAFERVRFELPDGRLTVPVTLRSDRENRS